MIRFLMIESTHPISNPRFDVGATYLWLIILLVVDDVLIDSDTLFNQLHESQDQIDLVF
jgi:hypothetical protein